MSAPQMLHVKYRNNNEYKWSENEILDSRASSVYRDD